MSAARNGTGPAELLLGIDVGTSACKAAVVSVDGAELAHGQAPTPWRAVATGAEADLDALFDAAVAAAREALDRAPEGRVAAIGVASIAESGALLDGAGEPLHPAIAWHDARGEAQAQAIARDLPEFAQHTGLFAIQLCTLAKLAHLRDALGAERLGAARRWLNVGEWVVRRLGGRDVAELSLSSRTGMFDMRAAAPYADALAWAGLPGGLLPEPALAGTSAGRHDGSVLPRARDAVLTVAGHDHLVAGVGVGVVAPGDVLDSCGTAEALVRVVAPPLDADATRRAIEGGTSVGLHVAARRQALLGGLWSGLALREVLEALGADAAEPAGREKLDAGALAIAPGDAPALELELRSLERPPVRLPEGAEPAAVWRAAIDAVTDAVAGQLEHLDAVAGPHTRVVVVGGWARDRAILDAKRRLGAIAAPPVVEAGCRGAALLAGVAAGLYESADDLPAVAGAEREAV
jgi:sugar (pentulose or hexulose) kinase